MDIVHIDLITDAYAVRFHIESYRLEITNDITVIFVVYYISIRVRHLVQCSFIESTVHSVRILNILYRILHYIHYFLRISAVGYGCYSSMLINATSLHIWSLAQLQTLPSSLVTIISIVLSTSESPSFVQLTRTPIQCMDFSHPIPKHYVQMFKVDKQMKPAYSNSSFALVNRHWKRRPGRGRGHKSRT